MEKLQSTIVVNAMNVLINAHPETAGKSLSFKRFESSTRNGDFYVNIIERPFKDVGNGNVFSRFDEVTDIAKAARCGSYVEVMTDVNGMYLQYHLF